MKNYNLEPINIKDLTLDKNNPRLPSSFQNKTEKEIINFMIRSSSISELMDSICANGYFPGEPLIVMRNSNDAEKKYTVIEGNRRTTALKLIHNPEIAESQKQKITSIAEQQNCNKPIDIPCLIADNLNEVQKFLGFRHITGVKNWKSLEKARYLNRMKKVLLAEGVSLDEVSKELASTIGSRSDYVRRVLIAYDVYLMIEENNFYDIHDLDDRSFHFTNLIDSLGRRSIAEYIGVSFENEGNSPLENLNESHLRDWCKWFFEKNSENTTRVKGISKQLTKLAKVLEKKESLEEFKSGRMSLEDAVTLTDHIDDLFYKSISQAKNHINNAKNSTARMDNFYTHLDKDLREIASICKEIMAIKNSKGMDEFDV